MSDLTLFEFMIGTAIGMWPVTIMIIILTIGLGIYEWREEREAKKNRRKNTNGRYVVPDIRKDVNRW